MRTIKLVAAKEHHVRELVSNSPPELIAEVKASHDMTVKQAADLSLREAVEAFAACTEGGSLLCLTGISPLSWDRACPWLLPTHLLAKYPRDLVRGTRDLLQRWGRVYPVLTNYIDARYTASLRWARHSGFEIYPAEPYGPFHVPFHQVIYRSN